MMLTRYKCCGSSSKQLGKLTKPSSIPSWTISNVMVPSSMCRPLCPILDMSAMMDRSNDSATYTFGFEGELKMLETTLKMTMTTIDAFVRNHVRDTLKAISGFSVKTLSRNGWTRHH